MQHLIPEQIKHQSTIPLTKEDRKLLTRIRYQQQSLLVVAYVLICCCCVFAFFMDAGNINLDNKSFRVHFSDSDTQGLQKLVPYTSLLVFIVASFFFARTRIRAILPITRGLNNGIKQLICYRPTRSIEASGPYYISLPLVKHPEVQLNREEFENIKEMDELCIEIIPGTAIVLRLKAGDKEISYS